VASNKKGRQIAFWLALIATLLGAAAKFLEALVEIIRVSRSLGL
jgi:hypothetical protein